MVRRTDAGNSRAKMPIGQLATGGLGSTLIESGLPSATVGREFDLAGLIRTIDLSLPKPSDSGNGETG